MVAPLADLEDVHHGIGVEQVFAAAHRAASDVAGNLDDGLHLGRLLERRGVDRIAALLLMSKVFCSPRTDLVAMDLGTRVEVGRSR